MLSSLGLQLLPNIRGVEISTCASSCIDDNIGTAFEFRLGKPYELRQYNLGFSLPLSPHILINPKIGLTCAREQYFNENDFMILLISEFALKQVRSFCTKISV